MNKIWVLFFLITTNYLYANKNNAYINVISNVENTVVFLDGKEIGTTPIKQFEVTPNKSLTLKAIIDKNYYKKNLTSKIKVNKATIPTYSLTFQKANAKIFLVGDDAELYINDKFVKQLHDTNRIVEVTAGQNVKIRLQNGESDAVYIKDIKAKTINTLKYKLVTIPKAVRLYTSIVDDLMWEDTKDAANTNINWEKGRIYCSNLEIAHYDDFRLPTIEELNDLYENKDQIYNGFGGKFYWSSSTFRDEHKVWDYSVVKNFEDGMNQKSIKEFEQGRIRCVRNIEIIEEKELNEIK